MPLINPNPATKFEIIFIIMIVGTSLITGGVPAVAAGKRRGDGASMVDLGRPLHVDSL